MCGVRVRHTLQGGAGAETHRHTHTGDSERKEEETLCVTHLMASAMRYGFAMANVARRCSSFSSGNNSRRLFQLSRSRLAVGVACRAAVQRTLSSYATKVEGAADSEDFRVFLTDASGKAISPWHDVPLYADEGKGTVNFFCEIPKETSAKMECATDEKTNPIKQDTKKGTQSRSKR